MIPLLDSILTGLIILLAVAVLAHRFCPRPRKKPGACGGSCACPRGELPAGVRGARQNGA